MKQSESDSAAVIFFKNSVAAYLTHVIIHFSQVYTMTIIIAKNDVINIF